MTRWWVSLGNLEAQHVFDVAAPDEAGAVVLAMGKWPGIPQSPIGVNAIQKRTDAPDDSR